MRPTNSCTEQVQRVAITRRGLLGVGLAGGVLAVTTACGGGNGSSAANVVSRRNGESAKDYLDRLYKAARGEGQVMVYGEADSEEFASHRKAFGAAYPGVTMSFVSGDEDVMTQRALTEERAGHPQADVYVDGGFTSMATLAEGGGLQKYQAVRQQFMAKEWVLPGPYIPDAYITKHVAFNTKLMSASDMPQTWDGYLDPRFKGKMAMDTNSGEWTAGIIIAMGKQPARSFLEKLAKQNIILVTGTTLRTEQLASGEFPVMLDGYGHSLKESIDGGKPIQVVVPPPGGTVTAIPDMSGLLTRAPHPNAARLFVEFLLMPAGQRVFAHETKPSTLSSGITPPYPEFMKGARLVILKPENAGLFKTADSWWHELFVKK